MSSWHSISSDVSNQDWDGTWLPMSGIANNNPKGCNQYTGKGCAGTSEESSSDPTANRPSKPEERVPDAKPTPLPWRDPPKPKGKLGGGALKERPKGSASNTAKGDAKEQAMEQLGFRNILPPDRRSLTPAQVKKLGSSIDREYDHSGRFYEVKSVWTSSTQLRARGKKGESANKERFARNHKGNAYTLVVIHDVDTGEHHVYAGKKPGMLYSTPNQRDFDYLGTYKHEGEKS